MIVAYRAAGRAVFLFGFAKNDRDNIKDHELQQLRVLGRTGSQLRRKRSGRPWMREI